MKPAGRSGHRPSNDWTANVVDSISFDPVFPNTPVDAHKHMCGMLDDALGNGKHALLVTMKPLGEEAVDVRIGIMNMTHHNLGLGMLAFAVVRMNKKAGTDIKDDLRKLGEYVGMMLE